MICDGVLEKVPTKSVPKLSLNTVGVVAVKKMGPIKGVKTVIRSEGLRQKDGVGKR